MFAAVTQAGANCFTGMYLGAVYFRTGKNIRFMIVLHAVYDFVLMIVSGRLSGVSLNEVLNPAGSAASSKTAALTVLVWAVIYIPATIIILRKKKIEPLLSVNADEDPSARLTDD